MGGVKLLKTITITASLLASSTLLKGQVTGNWPDSMGNKTNSKTHVNKAIGVNVSAPDAWQEIRYCPPPNNDQKGFVVTREVCAPNSMGLSTYNDNMYGYLSAILLDSNGGGGNQGNNNIVRVSFANPVALGPVPLTYYSTSGTTPSPKINPTGDQPLMLARTVKFNSSMGGGSYKSRFIVMPNGKSGFNTENPRAALDVQSPNVDNIPVAIFGNILPFSAAGAPPFTPVGGGPSIQQTYTNGLSIVPNTKLGGYNGISKKGDIGLFFTDAKGGEGSNSNDGAFVLAPFTKDSTKGGLRMEANGNTELRGNLRCTKVLTNAKWWPDFVFSSTYKLKTLPELKSYIQANGHLPGFPAESTVVSQGQDIGELQQAQQTAIEELSLHIINQNELIEKQAKELQAKATKFAEMEARLLKIEALLNLK